MSEPLQALPTREPPAISLVLWLLVILLPVHEALGQVWRPLGAWDDAAIALAAATLAMGAWKQRRAGWRPSRLGWLVAAFALVQLLSLAANGVGPRQALSSLRALLPYVVMVFAAAKIPPPRVPRYLSGLVCAGAAMAAYGLASFVIFRTLGGGRDFRPEASTPVLAFLLWPYRSEAYAGGWRLDSTFLNDNYFGMWMAALMVVAFGLLVVEARRGRRWALAAAIGLFGPALAWSGSRAAFVGFAACVVVLTTRVSWRALLLVAAFGAWMPFWLTPRDVLRYTEPAAFEGRRIRAVHMAARVLTDRPLLGRGPGNAEVTDVHYARILHQSGGLGLLAFLALLGHVFSPLLRRRADADGRLQAAVLAALVALAAGAIGGNVWEIPQLAHPFWMLAGFSESLRRDGKASRGDGT